MSPVVLLLLDIAISYPRWIVSAATTEESATLFEELVHMYESTAEQLAAVELLQTQLERSSSDAVAKQVCALFLVKRCCYPV